MFAEHRLSLVRRRTNWDVILRKLDVDEDATCAAVDEGDGDADSKQVEETDNKKESSSPKPEEKPVSNIKEIGKKTFVVSVRAPGKRGKERQ